MKAYFLQRVCAYFIDFIVIWFAATIVVSLVSSFISINDNSENYTEQTNAIIEKVKNGEENLGYYITETAKVAQNQYKDTYMVNIITMIVTIAYLVCYQAYNKGQTLGKRIMKIRVVRNDDEYATMNDMLLRELLLQGLITGIIVLALVQFIDGKAFAYAYYGFQGIDFAIFLAILLMVLFRKDGRGLHDLFGHTKVVIVDEAVSEVVTLKEAPVDGDIEEVQVVEEGSEENERTNRARNGKKRKSTRNSKDM